MTSAVLTLSGAVMVFAVSAAGMIRGEDPWATWFYPLAWYSTLVAADAVLRLRTGRWYLLGDWRFAASVLLWSIPFWLFFELANFRVANWYYVFVPADASARWIGIALSFATVLPAILVSQRLAADLGLGQSISWRPRLLRPTLPLILQVVGICFLALALLWPRFLFPLIWGGVTLLADPWVYARDRERSLLGALERGRPAIIIQLLVGGLLIGFLWELYNTQARGKWIYTVPGLEELKLFEMPVLGFFGFPILALDGWAVWNALVLAGLARGSSTRPSPVSSRWPTLGAAAAGAAFSVAVLAGMERSTLTSVTPSLQDVAGDAAPLLEAAGYDVFSLAEANPDGILRATGDPASRMWVQRARLISLRGIGTRNAQHLEAVGISSVATLSAADPEELFSALISHGAAKTRLARVRVWVRGAQGLH